MSDPAPPGEPAPPVAKRRRRWLRTLISLAITAAFVALFLQFGDPRAYLAIFRAVDPGSLALLIGFSIVLGLARGWRIALMLGRSLTLSLLHITLLYNFLAAVAPARLGELALPVLLKREGRTSFAEAMGVLLATRLYDFITLLYLAGLCLAVLAAQGVVDAMIGLWGAVACAAFLALALSLPAFGRVILDFLRRGEKRFPRLIGLAVRVGAVVGVLRGGRLARLIGASLLVWLVQLVIYQSGALAFGLTSRLAETMLAGAAGSFAFVLPINGVANVGPAQAAWAATLNLFGHPWDQAIAAGLAINLIILGVNGVVSGLLWLAGGAAAARKPAPGTAPPPAGE